MLGYHQERVWLEKSLSH